MHLLRDRRTLWCRSPPRAGALTAMRKIWTRELLITGAVTLIALTIYRGAPVSAVAVPSRRARRVELIGPRASPTRLIARDGHVRGTRRRSRDERHGQARRSTPGEPWQLPDPARCQRAEPARPSGAVGEALTQPLVRRVAVLARTRYAFRSVALTRNHRLTPADRAAPAAAGRTSISARSTAPTYPAGRDTERNQDVGQLP